MSRFYDRLLAGRWTNAAEQQTVAIYRERLADAEVVDVSEACSYYFKGTSQDEWEIARDFPTLAPPFETFFLESRLPDEFLAPEGMEAFPSGGPRCWGILFDAVDYGPSSGRVEAAHSLGMLDGSSDTPDTAAPDAETPRRLPLADALSERLRAESERRMPALREAAAKAGIPREQIYEAVPLLERGEREAVRQLMGESRLVERLRHAPDAGTREWLLRCTVSSMRWEVYAAAFTEWEKGKPYGPLCLYRLPIRDDGVAIADKEGRADTRGYLYVPEHILRAEPESADRARSLARSFLYPALFSLTLMHAPRVRLNREEPPAKLSRNHEKRHGQPLARYYTLDIDPFKEVLEGEGSASIEGLRRALHLCRGYFRRPKGSAPDAPRSEWVRSHMKGSAGSGEVHKDYSLVVPEEASQEAGE